MYQGGQNEALSLHRQLNVTFGVRYIKILLNFGDFLSEFGLSTNSLFAIEPVDGLMSLNFIFSAFFIHSEEIVF